MKVYMYFVFQNPVIRYIDTDFQKVGRLRRYRILNKTLKVYYLQYITIVP